jgi:hypothetical protein
VKKERDQNLFKSVLMSRNSRWEFQVSGWGINADGFVFSGNSEGLTDLGSCSQTLRGGGDGIIQRDISKSDE